MPLSKALVQSFRKNTLLIGAGWRSFFAPYNIALGSSVANTVLGPTILDLQNALPINTNAPPVGWFDLGWIKDFKVTPASKIGKVRSGYRGAVRTQYRGEVGETFEFKFREATRMAFKIAVGNTPFNLLVGSGASSTGPLSASGAPKTAMVSYTDATNTLVVTSASAISAVSGSYLVADVDYTGQSGVVGSSGQPLQPGQVTDIDYIRKTSDFVARVLSVSGNTLVLNAPGFMGGGSGNPTGSVVPPAGSQVQLIDGWAMREGATFISEWSAMFVMDTIDAAQICVYYPHVAISQFRDVLAWTIEAQGTTDQTGYELDAIYEALAFDDPIDGETVVGYKAFVPRPNQDIQV